MPWRWNLWSDVYGKTLMHLDPDQGGRPFVHDPSRKPAAEESKENAEEEGEGEDTAQELRIKNVKRLKKRQQQAREREAVLALRKLGLDVMGSEDAAAYRN